MSEIESFLLIQVSNRFKEALNDTNLDIKIEDKWQSSSSKGYLTYIDIVIYKNINPIAVIEVRDKLQGKNFLAISINQVRTALSITNARFGIGTKNKEL